jgi:hypothetical protein
MKMILSKKKNSMKMIDLFLSVIVGDGCGYSIDTLVPKEYKNKYCYQYKFGRLNKNIF